MVCMLVCDIFARVRECGLEVATVLFQSHSPQLNEILYFLPGANKFLTYSNHSDMDSDEVQLDL